MKAGEAKAYPILQRLRSMAGLLLLPVVLTGCWDRIEVNDIAFVLGSATDREGGQIRTTAQIALPSQLGGAGSQGGGGGTSGSKTYLLVSRTAPTSYLATKAAQTDLSRVLNYSHRRVTIFGEAFARAGIGEQIDVFARFPQNRLTTYVVLSRGPGYKLLDVDAPIEQVPAEMIRELAKSAMKDPLSIQRLANMLLTEGVDASIPVMEVQDSVPKKVGNGQSLVNLDGLGLFRDDKLVGYLTSEQAPLALMAMGQAINPKMTVTYDDKHAGELITVSLNETRTEIHPHLGKSGIRFDINFKAMGLILENTSKHDIQSTTLSQLEQRCNDKLAGQIHEVVSQVLKKHRTDIFGFGHYFNNKYPSEWKRIRKRWHEMLPDVEVRVHSDIHLENTGELINSLGVREDRLYND
ncbi:Ger(x)C family spore germination protein [Paenibacillus macerans]|uniref:Ger(x)C family spore germination protein n=1 Tax=Paenibacillus macerans TaxID=44252 RepID=UPI003D3167EC